MDTKDIICDIIDDYVLDGIRVEDLALNICKALGICDKCGAKLKGDRNE